MKFDRNARLKRARPEVSMFDHRSSLEPFRDHDKITSVEEYDSILFHRSHEYRRKFQIIMHCTSWRVLFLNKHTLARLHNSIRVGVYIVF